MNREEMLYQIYYSYCVELKFSRILGRIDKVLSFALILLGSSVIANAGSPFWIGIFIAAISAIKMAFHFESSSAQARKNAGNYLKLYNSSLNEESDSELQKKILTLQENDSDVWSVLIMPSVMKAQNDLGKDCAVNLSFRQKVFNLISG